jgi:hypothetical protein
VLWPTLSGVSLVPAAPNKTEPTEQEKAAPKPLKPAEASEDPDKAVPVSAVVPRAPKKNGEARAEIEKTLVVNCRDEKDRRLSECDTPGFDDVAKESLVRASPRR